MGDEFSATSQPFGAGDDLDQFSGDVGLAGAVIAEGQPVDHLAGIARSIVHRGHSRALLARCVFEQRGIDLHREIVRQQLGQDFLFARLEFVDRAANRLDHVYNNLANVSTNTKNATGRIMDVDFASESSSMTSNQMLMQAGTAMLKQTNSMSSMVMSLLQ